MRALALSSVGLSVNYSRRIYEAVRLIGTDGAWLTVRTRAHATPGPSIKSGCSSATLQNTELLYARYVIWLMLIEMH